MVNQVGILQLIVLLVEIGKSDPDFRGFASAFLWVNCLYGLCECLDSQVCVLVAKFDTIEPLIYIVGVLAQHNI